MIAVNDIDEEEVRTIRALGPYIERDVVRLLKHPSRTPTFQLEGWMAILQEAVRQPCDWLLLTDADAFLFPVREYHVKPIIECYDVDHVAALAIYTCTFGSGGVKKRPATQTQSFFRRAPIEAECNWTANYLLRPDRMQPASIEAGYAAPLPGYEIVDENMYPIGKGKRQGPQKNLRLNHYSVRSQEDWKKKQARGWPEAIATWLSPKPIAEHKKAMLDRNEVFDDSMRRYERQLTDALARSAARDQNAAVPCETERKPK